MTLDHILGKALEERMMVLQDGLQRGAPENYPAYTGLVGEIRGVRFAMEQLNQARKRAGLEEDDE